MHTEKASTLESWELDSHNANRLHGGELWCYGKQWRVTVSNGVWCRAVCSELAVQLCWDNIANEAHHAVAGCQPEKTNTPDHAGCPQLSALYTVDLCGNTT